MTISIILYILTKISIILFAGGFLLHKILGWDIASAAIFMVIIADIYAIAGDLKTIVHVDILQSFVLIIGASLVSLISLHEISGFSMIKPISDPNFP